MNININRVFESEYLMAAIVLYKIDLWTLSELAIF